MLTDIAGQTDPLLGAQTSSIVERTEIRFFAGYPPPAVTPRAERVAN